jgi:hypothetical protein
LYFDSVHPIRLSAKSILTQKRAFKLAFIDFNRIDSEEISKQRFHMKGYNHFKSHNLSWSQIYDGVVYLENMYPCNKGDVFD